MNKKPAYFFIQLMLAALLLNACSFGKQTDKVTVQLSWFHSVEYAGFYTAIEQGYYDDENLEVTLVAGGPEVDALAEVENGNAQFGIGTGDSLVSAKSQQRDFLALATIFRNNPLVIMSLADGNIQKPEDLAEKTIGVIAPDLSTGWDVQTLALLQTLNMDESTLNFVPINDYHGANELNAGTMDAMSGMFATNEPVQAQLDGNQINMIYYKDYGVDVYSNVIFTNGEFASNNPDLLARFIQATMKGYQYSIENPTQAAETSLKFDPSLNLALQTATMNAQIPFIATGDAPIGSMDADVWETTQQILLDFGVIPAKVDISTIYTNEYVTP
jgi:ABC-type nitrate/sulfonate/bicarbonate transport system substrate-binding protein